MRNGKAPTIEMRGLTKDYGEGRGLFEADLAVGPGEVVGFLGANGAGKTVTMRLLMGFIRPNAGSASICGLDCLEDRPQAQAAIGYLPGEIALPRTMRARDFLDYMAELRGIDDPGRRRALEARFELDTSARIGSMSKGTKQKVAIVSAFMGAPRALLLDEPTSGLDPLMQSRFIDLVLEEKRRGTTILLSSHLFEEVERTCDRVAFIRGGKLAAVERMDDVRKSRKRLFVVTFADEAARDRYAAAHRDTDGCGEAGFSVQKQGTTSVETAVSGNLDAFVKDLAAYEIVDLTAREQTLEELFMHLYGTFGDASNRRSGLKGGSHE